jgi:hypothetical protein
VTAIISPDLTFTTQPIPITECIGGTNQLNVVTTGGSGTNTYAWQTSPNGINTWTAASGPGSGTPNYTPPSLSQGVLWYRVLILASGSGCDNALSDTARVTVTPDLSITSQPNNVLECIGGTNSMNVLVTGGTGIITYQWQSSATNVPANFANIAGATNLSYVPSSATVGTTYYRVIISASASGCDAVLSNVVTAIITNDIAITLQPVGGSICVGGNLTLTVTATGSPG